MKILSSTVACILLLTFESAVFTANARTIDTDSKPDSDPAASLRTTFDQIRLFQNSPQASDPAAVRTFIDTKLMPRFAFASMSHWIAGPFARYMTSDEKSVMAHQLSSDIKAFLSSNFHRLDFNTSQIRIHDARYSDVDKATVVVQVYPKQARSLNLSFRMQLKDQRWKMVDIRSFGTSLTMYYRARYIDQLRSYRYRSARRE